jgi:hypothetical protein
MQIPQNRLVLSELLTRMVLNFSYILDKMTLSVSIAVFPSVLGTNLSLFCRVQLLLKCPKIIISRLNIVNQLECGDVLNLPLYENL